MKTETPKTDGDAEQQLDSFVLEDRLRALKWLAAHAGALPPPAQSRVNMHIHSFFSFNTYGYSPSHIAWKARQEGLVAAGLCDFDVLDGMEEFLHAGLTLGLCVAVNLETRAFWREYADVDINSPGEPGVTYIMGAGFARPPPADSPEAATLTGYRRQASERNRALVQRINAHLPDIAVDYLNEVVPLTPAGCPTERHIVRAYRLKAEAVFPSRVAWVEFWSKLMKRTPTDIVRQRRIRRGWKRLSAHLPALEEAIRSMLVKRGGIGYEPPTDKTFPPVDDFIAWALKCEAIPMATWLDGASPGEQDTMAMLECLQDKGACALNLIPHRNHLIADPAVRALKLQKLAEVIQAAETLAMPINIGTEMNKEGQPLVDDTECDALRPYHETFLRGARIMVGQTLLARYAGFSYAGPPARAEFGNDLKRKNQFFESVGRLPPLTGAVAAHLEKLGREKAFARLRDSSARGQWAL